MKIDKKYIKIGAITLASIGVIWGGYKIVKHFIAKNQERENQNLPVEVVIASNEVEKKEVEKPAFNTNKVVKLGSKDSEAKTVQTALNNIISDMSKAKTPVITKTITPQFNWGSSSNSNYSISNQKPFVDTQIDKQKEATRKYIAGLKPLIADGDFGAKSVIVLKGILGKDSATYNEVKNKRLSLANQFGLGNPYKK
jgi:hypothetical protein